MSGDVPEGWASGHLGTFLSEHHDRVGERVDLEPLSLTKHQGLILARERFGRALYSKDVGRYRHVRLDDIVVDPMLLWDGAFARLTRFEEGFVSPDYRVFRVNQGQIHTQFLEYWLRGPDARRAFENGARGTNVRRNRIGRSDFLEVGIATPPLPEQKKIAAILSSVDAAIRATQAVIDQARRVKDGLLQDLLTRGIGHSRFKQTEIGEIPESWDCVRTPAIAEGGDRGIAGGPFGSSLTSKDYLDRPGIPVIRGTNLTYNRGTFALDGFVFVSEAKAEELARNLAAPGDLVVTQRGTLGQVGLIPVDVPYKTFVVSQSQMKLTPDRTKIRARYLWYFAGSKVVLEWVDRNTIATGVPHINLGLFKQLPVPVPPLQEQDRIVKILDSVQDSLDEMVGYIERLNRTKSGLLQDLLTGRVRVAP